MTRGSLISLCSRTKPTQENTSGRIVLNCLRARDERVMRQQKRRRGNAEIHNYLMDKYMQWYSAFCAT